LNYIPTYADMTLEFLDEADGSYLSLALRGEIYG
jgi:hypothetical protein